jgi:hypothetical protein
MTMRCTAVLSGADSYIGTSVNTEEELDMRAGLASTDLRVERIDFTAVLPMA